MTITSSGRIIAYRASLQNIDRVGNSFTFASILEIREEGEERGRDNRRSCPIRQTSDRERRKGSAALTRSVLFILLKCFRIFPARGELGQEVRLRSGRNLSRARNPLSRLLPTLPNHPLLFRSTLRWWVESKRVSPGRRSKRVRFCPVYSGSEQRGR